MKRHTLTAAYEPAVENLLITVSGNPFGNPLGETERTRSHGLDATPHLGCEDVTD
jgi:hypothetical protein